VRACCLASRLCNAALRKAAYQVSEWFEHRLPHPALLATDGRKMASLEAGSCAVSGSAVDPWLVVDIGAAMKVNIVALTTREHTHYSYDVHLTRG